MKRKSKIFFHPIDGSAPLSIYWYPGPYGDALEAAEGNGVYFTAPNGDLLGVQFDDICEEHDQQSLTTKQGARVQVHVRSGKVRIMVENAANIVA